MVHWHCPFEIDLRVYVSQITVPCFDDLDSIVTSQVISLRVMFVIQLSLSHERQQRFPFIIWILNFIIGVLIFIYYSPLFHQLPPIDYPHKAIDFIQLSIRSNYYQSEDSISFIVVYQPSICFRLRWNTIRCSPLVRKSDPWQCVETFSKYILRLLPSSNWI